MKIDTIYNVDCLEGMQDIPNHSIDFILCDLPYGVLHSKWDCIIPFDKLWEQYERIITNNGVIALFSSGLFTNKVIFSNEKLYKYKWIWKKNIKTNFMNSKNRPLSEFEEILIFSKGNIANGTKNRMNYNPQGLQPLNKIKKNHKGKFGTIAHDWNRKEQYFQKWTNYPSDILEFDVVPNNKKIHTSEKPTELLEYLIKTYTNEGDVVLDNCSGSGSTAVACIRTKRHFIGYELDETFYNLSMERIENETN